MPDTPPWKNRFPKDTSDDLEKNWRCWQFIVESPYENGEVVCDATMNVSLGPTRGCGAGGHQPGRGKLLTRFDGKDH